MFEEYVAPAERSRTTPYFTLDANARLYFSAAAAQAFDIKEGKYEAVKLYFSKQASGVKMIAIKLLQEEEAGALKIKYPPQGGAIVNAKAFAIKYGIMNGEKLSDRYKGKYVPEKAHVDGIGEVFIIHLE